MKLKENVSIDLLYNLAILNSSIMQYYYQNKYKAETNIFPKIRIIQVKELPIKIDLSFNSERIKETISKIIALKKINFLADTYALEKEIDQLVYELYGLTEEDIKIVEGTIT